MTTSPAKRVLIVGGGTAGWMVAAALARFLPANYPVSLIESDAIGTIGVGEATIPQIRNFNAALGIDESEFVRATQGSFKLGIAFEGWRAPGHRYMHAFGIIGRSLGLLPFYHYWLRGHAADESSLDSYSVGAQAAYAGRFAPADPARPAAAGGHAHAFHFDASLYAAFLRRYAEGKGVSRVEGRITDIARNPDNGDIAGVTLESGATIDADLYIDCSGFAALLIGQTMGVGYDDWSRWLPCDRAIAVPSGGDGPPRPYTRSIARPAGWQWQIPLQHRVGNGIVYSSAHMTDDAAQSMLLANLPGAALAEPRQLRFAAGRRVQCWVGNVVAIGLSSGFLEPLESTSIHLIQSGIERLLQRFPRVDSGPVERDAFNADAAREMELIRDFIILHYWANGRDEPFWRERRAEPLPDRLADRIALFQASGRIDRADQELFTEWAWQQVLIGQGVMPDAYHPLANAIGEAALTDFLDTNRRSVASSVVAMPQHGAYIDQYCRAQEYAA